MKQGRRVPAQVSEEDAYRNNQSWFKFGLSHVLWPWNVHLGQNIPLRMGHFDATPCFMQVTEAAAPLRKRVTYTPTPLSNTAKWLSFDFHIFSSSLCSYQDLLLLLIIIFVYCCLLRQIHVKAGTHHFQKVFSPRTEGMKPLKRKQVSGS